METHNNVDTRKSVVSALRTGTRVLTSDGIVNIEELQNKFFEIRNITGKWSRARCQKSDDDALLYKITLTNGKEYFSTPEHIWPVLITKIDAESEDTKDTKTQQKTVMRIPTRELKAKNMLPYVKSDSLYSSHNAIGTYTDGFCLGMLHTCSTDFITDSSIAGENYIWAVPQEWVDTGLDKILTTWMSGIDYSPIRAIDKEDDKKNKFRIYTTQSIVFSKYMDTFGISSIDNVKNKTFGVPKAVWTGSEDFRAGFIDGIYSMCGGINEHHILGYIPSASETFVRDICDLLGFYGIASTVRVEEKSTGGENMLPLILFEADLFSQMFHITHKKRQNLLDDVEHKNQNSIGEIEVASCVPTTLKDTMYSIIVYDSSHMFALSHCLTGNCENRIKKNIN